MHTRARMIYFEILDACSYACMIKEPKTYIFWE